METIEQISHETFYNMQKYSQLTIDFTEEVEDVLDLEYETEQERRDEVGSLCYRIDLTLEIINPALEEDIKVLKQLQFILNDLLEEWKK